MFDVFDENITEHWIDLVIELSRNHYSNVRLSGYQEFLFDRYLKKFDGAIENALQNLGTFDEDINLDQDFEKTANEANDIFQQFMIQVFSTMGKILGKIDTNQELVVAFYVLYTIYAQMQDDYAMEIQINSHNSLFFKALKDFTTVYTEVIQEDLPLPEDFREQLVEEQLASF